MGLLFHRNQRRPIGYWCARFFLNGLAIAAFAGAVKVVGVEFTWGLYWSAFIVYVVLSFGDAIMAEIWPKEKWRENQ